MTEKTVVDGSQIGLTEHDVDDLKRIHELRWRIEEMEDEVKFLQSRLVKEIPSGATVKVDGTLFVTAVYPKPKLVIDASRLKEIDPYLHDLVVESKVSDAKVRTARQRGYFRKDSPEMAAVTATRTPSAYLRINHGAENSQGDEVA